MSNTSPLLYVAQVRTGDKGWPVTDLIITNTGKHPVFDISCKGILWNDYSIDIFTDIQKADTIQPAESLTFEYGDLVRLPTRGLGGSLSIQKQGYR